MEFHENALSLKARRMEVLSNNIANADTPGYKARDVDFQKVLSWQLGAGGLETTHSGHLASPHALDNGQGIYDPLQHVSRWQHG
jgi:flagellar basal-body rod protein FlgB